MGIAAAGSAAQQIKDHEAAMAHRILDVIAEDPQEPHIAEQMHPATVQEHVGEHRRPVAAVGDHATRIGADGDADTRRKMAEQLAGQQAQGAD